MDKGIFLTNQGWEGIERAYSSATRRELEKTISFYPGCRTMEALEQAPGDVTVLFSTWGMPALSEEQIQQYFPKLEAVFYAAGSVQRFARPLLNRGVRVFSAAPANAIPVAEYTVGQILLANKGFFQSSARLRARTRREAHDYAASFPGNMNCKVGIIGAGAIGKLVIQLLKPFRLEVLVFDPFLPDETARGLEVKKVGLETLFQECQTISNHLANNTQTQGMLHYGLFSRMRPNATFINTGRGAQVVEADLCRALRECPDRTALLDVTFPEPPSADSELFTLENIILTPHIAGSMANEVGRMGEYMLQAYQDFRRGLPSRCEVRMEMLDTMA